MDKAREKTGRRRRIAFSLRTILAVTFGTLVAVAVGAVLYLSVMVSFSNTFSLLNDRAISMVYGMEDAIRAETARAEGAVEAIATLYSRGEIADGGDETMLAAMRALLTSERTIEILIVLRPGSEIVALQRAADGRVMALPPGQLSEGFAGQILSYEIPSSGTPQWGEPVRIADELYHIALRALSRDGRPDGVAVAAIGRDTMNRVVSTLGEREGATAFVLNGDGDVIAHSRLPLAFMARDAIAITDFPDDALRAFPDAELSDEFSAAAERGISVYDTASQNGYAYLTKELPGYASRP